MAKRITQKQIGEALGVSYITVQRALNNSGYVSRDLRNRILKYARKVRYTPHKAAQSLVRKKTRTIAVYSSDFPQYFWSEMKKGVMIAGRQIAPFNYEVYYRFIPAWDSSAYLRQLRSDLAEGVDAVGLVNQIFSEMNTVFAVLEDHRIPFILVNVDAPETNRLCYIGPDYPSGGRIAADLILRMTKGRRRPKVGVILNSFPLGVWWVADVIDRRFEGFRQVISNADAPVELVTRAIPLSAEPQEVEREIDGFLSGNPDLEALYVIASYNEIVERVIARQEKAGALVTIVHDLDSRTEECLDSDIITAVIYQNPILQGYYTVKLLEHFLETGKALQQKEINIVHSIVMKQNRDLYKNHYLFAEIIGEIEG